MNKKATNSPRTTDNTKKSQYNNKKNLSPKHISPCKKNIAPNNIKNKVCINININNNIQGNFESKKNSNNNKNKKFKKTPNKKEPRKTKNYSSIQNKKMHKKIGTIESYPSILSTDTLTIKNNNINSSKKNASEYIFSFNPSNFLNKNSKSSSSCTDIKNKSNNKIITNNIKRNEDKQNNFLKNLNTIQNKYMSEVTTAEKNESKKNLSNSEENDVKIKYDRFRQNIKQKDLDKIKLDFKLEQISTINEIDSSRNNSGFKEKKNHKLFEPDFLKEIKHKNDIKAKDNSSKEKYNTLNSLAFRFSSNTTSNKMKYNFKNFNFNTHNAVKNKIINCKTYSKELENNYYIFSPISSTFKQINSRKSNLLSKQSEGKPLEDIDEDDIATVKQENTILNSKIDSITSETYKDIQKPRNSVYFFEAPEEENYNHIQGPIEFEYENSSEKNSLMSKNNSKDIKKCSRLNNINIYKIEEKTINNDDDEINYYDNMKENDEILPYFNNNNMNKIFSSISSFNDKTISNNDSFSNYNGNWKNNIENKNDKNKCNNVTSYQKKIIRNNFESYKNKPFKISSKINQNFSGNKKKEILLYRLKNYKIEYIISILQKIFQNHIRLIFNKFKDINLKTNQFVLLIEKVYYSKNKREFFNQLLKYSLKTTNKEFPLLLPSKNYPNNQNNCNMHIFGNYNLDSNQLNSIPKMTNNEVMNHSYVIHHENNNIPNSIRNTPHTIRSNYTQNNIFKKPILNLKLLNEKDDSFLYVKKRTLLGSKKTISSSSNDKNQKDKIIQNNFQIRYKRNIIPKNAKKDFKTFQNQGINKANKIKNIKGNNFLTNFEKNERNKDNIKSNNIIEDYKDALTDKYTYKLLDEDLYNDDNHHRNLKTDLDDVDNECKKIDSLKAYFFKEVEKIEFPDGIENNNDENEINKISEN